METTSTAKWRNYTSSSAMEQSAEIPILTGWSVHLHGIEQRPMQWIASAQYQKCCHLAQGAQMTYTNQPGYLYTVCSRTSGLHLSPPGPVGVSLWQTFWQTCLNLACFFFFSVVKRWYFTWYQLSWGMYLFHLSNVKLGSTYSQDEKSHPTDLEKT